MKQIKLYGLIKIILALLAGYLPVNAQTVTMNPTIVAQVGAPAPPYVGWSTPLNAISSNNAYATAFMNSLFSYKFTLNLRATGFGFAIPAGAIINGIRVRVERKTSNGAAVTIDLTGQIRLVKAGVAVGTDQSNGLQLTTLDAYTTYGSCTNLWGTSWTPAQINAANFGVEVAFGVQSGASTTVSVDHIEITVCYTTVLPIELLDFTAKCENKKAVLQWTTATETNNSFYTVEKSYNGEAWEILGSLAGAGNSVSLKKYLFTDNASDNATTYYRLKQTDFNGEFVYSDIIYTQCNYKGEYLVYPTKSNGGFTFKTMAGGLYTLLNTLGQHVFNLTLEPQSINTVDLSFLKEGMYFVISNEKEKVQKIILEK